jgi:hypothetical protein
MDAKDRGTRDGYLLLRGQVDEAYSPERRLLPTAHLHAWGIAGQARPRMSWGGKRGPVPVALSSISGDISGKELDGG